VTSIKVIHYLWDNTNTMIPTRCPTRMHRTCVASGFMRISYFS
jgi:hypothetical protein